MAEEQGEISTILVVDDTPANVDLLEAFLSAEYSIRVATCGVEALKSAQKIQPDLILLDITMPGMNGYEVCGHLKDTPHLRDIPVIFLSSFDSAEAKVKAFKSGGVDYITKPFHVSEVQARVRTHLTIRKLQLQLEAQNQALEQIVAERAQLAMIVDSSNDAIFSVSLDDIITSWNRGAENVFGYSAGEIIGRDIFTIIPPERHNERAHILQTILSGTQVDHFETTRIRKDRSQIYVSITTSPLFNAEGKIAGNSVIARDVTERRELAETIKYLAYHDNLTDLPNRQLFMDFLDKGLARARRHRKSLALLFLDLNGFKQVNDTFGHSCGDLLLQEVARRLKTSIRESDIVARLGGDEFTLLMPDFTKTDDNSIMLRKILAVFEAPFILDGVTVECSASIGVSMFPEDGDCCEELMKKADSAMYEAKGTGGNSYQFYHAGITTHSVCKTK